MPRAAELDEDFFALTMRRTLAEEQKGVNAGRHVAIRDDTKRYRGLLRTGGKEAKIGGLGPRPSYGLHRVEGVALVS